ncbi:MAG TPA: hypothetical protein VHA12_00390 [Candidatus Nanoarchaeia archaeon]|nr:hypothetical protein [Candidatus Nanoarchaeia archaeon]
MFNENKRGQVALFVIIALVIVGVLLLIFLFPKSKIGADIDENPTGYLRSCIEPGIKPEIARITSQGGFSNPEGFILYNGVKVKYLCYTSENYKTCVNQAPMIVGQVENEISRIIETNTQKCLDQMKTDYQKRGISVSTGSVKTNTSINTNGINILIESPITITKENTQTYRNFEVVIPSELYTILMASTSIVEFESTYGDAETTLYLQYYPNLKIRKNLLSDGTTIYNVEDYITNENFTFASRSVVWPSGYGIE